MPRTSPKPRREIARRHGSRRGPATIALLLASFACLGLAACGSSSHPSASSSASPSAATTATTATAATTPAATKEAETTKAATTTKTTPAQEAAYKRQRAGVMSLVGCIRRHGFHLPEPDAHNNIDTSGVNVKDHRYEAVVRACFKAFVRRNAKKSGGLEGLTTGR